MHQNVSPITNDDSKIYFLYTVEAQNEIKCLKYSTFYAL